jgi:hypothetical protein
MFCVACNAEYQERTSHEQRALDKRRQREE